MPQNPVGSLLPPHSILLYDSQRRSQCQEEKSNHVTKAIMSVIQLIVNGNVFLGANGITVSMSLRRNVRNRMWDKYGEEVRVRAHIQTTLYNYKLFKGSVIGF